MESSRIAVVPGRSFGSFTLGSDLLSVVRTLKLDSARYGSWQVITSSEDNSDSGSAADADGAAAAASPPATKKNCLQLRLQKLHTVLEFDARTQLLQSVRIDDVLRCGEVQYKGSTLCGPNMPPTFIRVYDVIGPTFQGHMDSEVGVYTLRYPGIHVIFEIPHKFRHLYNDGENSDHPMTLPDGKTPVASSIIVDAVVRGQVGEKKQLPGSAAAVAPVVVPSPISGRVLPGDDVQCDPTAGITFHRSGVSISYSMMPQEVVSLLGTPDHVYARTDDRLLIHNPTLAARPKATSAPSYFFAYPLLGIDIMFDGLRNTVSKITCYSSLPCHETFLKYLKCFFATTQDGVKIDGETNFLQDVKPKLPRCPQPLLHSVKGVGLKLFCFRGAVYHVVASTGQIAAVMIFQCGPTPITILPSAAAVQDQSKPSARRQGGSSPKDGSSPKPQLLNASTTSIPSAMASLTSGGRPPRKSPSPTVSFASGPPSRPSSAGGGGTSPLADDDLTEDTSHQDAAREYYTCDEEEDEDVTAVGDDWAELDGTTPAAISSSQQPRRRPPPVATATHVEDDEGDISDHGPPLPTLSDDEEHDALEQQEDEAAVEEEEEEEEDDLSEPPLVVQHTSSPWTKPTPKAKPSNPWANAISLVPSSKKNVMSTAFPSLPGLGGDTSPEPEPDAEEEETAAVEAYEEEGAAYAEEEGAEHEEEDAAAVGSDDDENGGGTTSGWESAVPSGGESEKKKAPQPTPKKAPPKPQPSKKGKKKKKR